MLLIVKKTTLHIWYQNKSEDGLSQLPVSRAIPCHIVIRKKKVILTTSLHKVCHLWHTFTFCFNDDGDDTIPKISPEESHSNISNFTLSDYHNSFLWFIVLGNPYCQLAAVNNNNDWSPASIKTQIIADPFFFLWSTPLHSFLITMLIKTFVVFFSAAYLMYILITYLSVPS